jgi:DNA-directed RNA polymerase II subunit RPB2
MYLLTLTQCTNEQSLVQTQIASFDEFVQNTIQELVDESPTLTLSSNAGAAGREEDENAEDARRHEINVLIFNIKE